MAIDSFIIPLSKYLAGDYTTSLEDTFGKVNRISVFGKSIKKYKAYFTKSKILKIQAELSKINVSYKFINEGSSVYASQFHSHDLFNDFIKQQNQSNFPQLLDLNVYSGLVVPIEFEQRINIENLQLSFSTMHSGITIQAELNVLNETLLVPEEWDHKEWPDKNFHARAALYQLREMLRLSISNNLPIIFWG